jgi:hypothetical protein
LDSISTSKIDMPDWFKVSKTDDEFTPVEWGEFNLYLPKSSTARGHAGPEEMWVKIVELFSCEFVLFKESDSIVKFTNNQIFSQENFTGYNDQNPTNKIEKINSITDLQTMLYESFFWKIDGNNDKKVSGHSVEGKVYTGSKTKSKLITGIFGPFSIVVLDMLSVNNELVGTSFNRQIRANYE